MSKGALHGVRVIEFSGIGPAPYTGMLLADMGADVIVIDRAPNALSEGKRTVLNRGKRSIVLDLKKEADIATVWKLLASADILIEGFRPGVMERLGFAPDVVHARFPKMVYGRMTGWGQTGPLAQRAGHDINYVGLTGALELSNRPDDGSAAPVIPPTLIGDVGGGAMFLAFGIMCALFEAQKSGKGQVVDAAIVDGVNHMMSLVHAFRDMGVWSDEPKSNFFSHASHFYETFACADGKYMSVGAIEPQFYAQLMEKLGLPEEASPMAQYDMLRWEELKKTVSEVFASQSQAHWITVFEGSDACVFPVLSIDEAAQHPHNVARGNFVKPDGVLQSAPAPRLLGTPAPDVRMGCFPGEHTQSILDALQ